MLLFILAGSLISQPILDTEMSSQDRKKTGVYKLTEKEKSALYTWIENSYVKRDVPLQAEPVHGMLQENLRSGTYIRLSNNSLWNIHPDDVPITQGWITPVDITVTQTGDSEYPYKLTNTLSGSSVRAKKVENLPPAPPLKTTQPPIPESH